jgi:hypothetical protein
MVTGGAQARRVGSGSPEVAASRAPDEGRWRRSSAEGRALHSELLERTLRATEEKALRRSR